ncbi:DUF1778 domain-containing protein [Trinickia sp.]|uniref:type II toxin-antitoxin system TacA family antitoxin n=1 Tax=Trinickia sp. TaxID=2571163 RepID=UPI003F807CB6
MSVSTLWVQERIFDCMSKDRSPPSKKLQPALDATERARSVSETKDSINLRIDTRSRELIDEAAAVLGKTRTEFMLECARQQAIDVLLDQRLFMLDADRFDAFVRVIDDPPAPGPKLRSLLRRVPAWEK